MKSHLYPTGKRKWRTVVTSVFCFYYFCYSCYHCCPLRQWVIWDERRRKNRISRKSLQRSPQKVARQNSLAGANQIVSSHLYFWSHRRQQQQPTPTLSPPQPYTTPIPLSLLFPMYFPIFCTKDGLVCIWLLRYIIHVYVQNTNIYI